MRSGRCSAEEEMWDENDKVRQECTFVEILLYQPFHAIVETDCLEAVKMIYSEEICLANEGAVVEGIKTLLRQGKFQCVSYASRVVNMVAHEIAKFVARSDGRLDWFGVGPPWLMSVVYNDSHVTSSNARIECGESVSSTEGSIVM